MRQRGPHIARILLVIALLLSCGEIVRATARIPDESALRARSALATLAATEGDSVIIKPGTPLSLEPNAPNPFRSTTVISYTLDRETVVTLTIYDCFYNEILILVDDEVKVSGRYSVRFDPDLKLATGVYFYTLETTAGRETRRMLYIR